MKNAKNKSLAKQQSTKSKSTFNSSSSHSSNSSSYNSPTVSGTSFTNLYGKQNQHDSSINTKQFRPLQGLSVVPNSEENSLQFEYIPNVTDSFSPSSSSSSAITITPTETPIPSKSKSNRKLSTDCDEASKCLMRSISSHKFLFDDNQEKSADLMIYLNLKETVNNVDFAVGFKNFLWKHYKEEPCNYLEQIRQFNYFREVNSSY